MRYTIGITVMINKLGHIKYQFLNFSENCLMNILMSKCVNQTESQITCCFIVFNLTIKSQGSLNPLLMTAVLLRILCINESYLLNSVPL